MRPVDSIDWPSVAAALDGEGWAIIPGLLSAAECDAVAASYDGPDDGFRKRVVMGRHGYGAGEYRYFAYPLPPLVQSLRESLYAPLVPIANRWQERLRMETRFPPTHAEFVARCHAAGQTRPTPLLLAYGPGDYNRLHQDLYGEHVFPLQVVTLLSEPGRAFTGGELVLTEQRARMQSRPMVVPLGQGDAAVIAVNLRPQLGPRGEHRVALRHGVSQVRSGSRRTLGLIFHDAA